MAENTHTREIILVPIDFQEASLRALDVAKSLALCFDADVVLLHVYQLLVQTYPGLPSANVSGLPGIHQEVAQAAQKALNELAADQGGLRTILVEGDAAQAILAEAERRRPRMIVMGTHGRSGLDRMLLGSVAEKVIRQSLAPVTVVRALQR